MNMHRQERLVKQPPSGPQKRLCFSIWSQSNICVITPLELTWSMAIIPAAATSESVRVDLPAADDTQDRYCRIAADCCLLSCMQGKQHCRALLTVVDVGNDGHVANVLLLVCAGRERSLSRGNAAFSALPFPGWNMLTASSRGQLLCMMHLVLNARAQQQQDRQMQAIATPSDRCKYPSLSSADAQCVQGMAEVGRNIVKSCHEMCNTAQDGRFTHEHPQLIDRELHLSYASHTLVI